MNMVFVPQFFWWRLHKGKAPTIEDGRYMKRRLQP